MTDKEKIEEMGADICKGCNSRLDPTFECNRNVCAMAEIVSEYLISIGWTKQVWHKVADGDLPKDDRAIRWLDKGNCYIEGYYDTDTQKFVVDCDNYFYKDEIIAWTELPEYKE